jgi:hypothetical protein
VKNVPEKVGKVERLGLAHDGLRGGHILILLSLHEILDYLLGLVEVVQVPVTVIIEKRALIICFLQELFALVHPLIICIALILDVDGK